MYREIEEQRTQLLYLHNSERKNITDALEKAQIFVNEINDKQNLLITDLEILRTELLHIDQLHTKKEHEDAEQIGSMLDEISALKFAIRTFEAKNYECKLI